MFKLFTKPSRHLRVFMLLIMSLLGVAACNSEPPELMKASKQFDTEEQRDRHIAYMRKNHMDVLMHKRDETMYKGIRTKKGSLNACIDCHVPYEYEGKALRHTDDRHFCSTCHGYVAEQLNCFECHADRPQQQTASVVPDDVIHQKVAQNEPQTFSQTSNQVDLQAVKTGDSSSE